MVQRREARLVLEDDVEPVAEFPGRSEVLEAIVTEMYARGLSVRDVEEAMMSATGAFVLSDTSVSQVTEKLYEQYEAFRKRDLSGYRVEYLLVDAVYESLRRYGCKQAVLCCWGICTDVEPQTELEKVLYAIDELTGLVVTAALVRPSKSVLDMKAKSVKKKWKNKRFAAGVDRSIINKGAEMLNVELAELITDTIMGMREVAPSIGLKGTIA